MKRDEDTRSASGTIVTDIGRPSRRAVRGEAETVTRLAALIADNEDWLTERVIVFAKARGYTPHTSTLKEAWEASVRGLSQSILEQLTLCGGVADVDAAAEIGGDPSSAYGIEAARRHRMRGVTLGSFIGLTKSYREAYVDLGERAGLDRAAADAYAALIGNFFDRMEIGVCAEWVEEPGRKQAELLRTQNRALVNEKNKYLTIFESLQEPVFLVGGDDVVENMNFAASRLFAPRAVPGGSYYGPDRLRFADLTGFDWTEARDAAIERELVTGAGTRWFVIRTQPMLDVSEKFLGTVVILNDVTEHRRAEERAEAAARAKSDFLATMSHEIRTPIHGILGTVELLGQSRLGPHERAYVEAIGYSSDLLASIVSDILDYSRIEAGHLELEHVDFSIDAVLEEVRRLIAPAVRRKPDLLFDIEAPVLPRVVGDPVKLRQILLNLVANAVKFTDWGMVRVTVEDRGEDAEPGRRRFRFTVTDTGIGIAPDRLDAIFEPFTQSDASVTRRFGGTGLGLAICRRLAALYGGTLGVASTPGEGSAFWLDLPFDVRTPSGTAEGDPIATGTVPPTRALDLLVIEDNEVNALVASSLLTTAGHHVRVAGSGEEALIALGEASVDLIFMDLHLPDIDGFELARSIRGLANRRKAATPIVALSAHGLMFEAEELAAHGIDGYLGKPFRSTELEDVLRRVAGYASPRPIGAVGDVAADPGCAGIDEKVLGGHVEALGVELTAQIVATFRRTVEEAAGELAALMEAGDWPAVAATAHRLKSSARHVGCTCMGKAAADVEAAIGADGSGETTAGVLALIAACSTAAETIDAAWARIAGREGQAQKT
jgi:signal transduction histidine kinase/ActR/RegA family two-component response regulator/HPt (histidine-containing phosphotransfer) domain-containing protein